MTHGVVERLEAIEIYKQHSMLPLGVAPRPGKQVLQAIEEETAVGQPGQSIVKRVVLEFFFRSLALGHVAIHDDQLCDLALLVPDGAGHRLEHPPAAVFVADAVFQLFPDSRAAGLARCLQHLETILWMDLLKRRSLGEFRRRITQNSFIRGTVVEPPPLHID